MIALFTAKGHEMIDKDSESAGAKSEESGNESKSSATKPDRREIKGGIPYLPAPGTLKKTLDLIVPAERPDRFSANYMSTILKLSGGSASAVPPFLKKMQFLASDGSPTLLYSKFKTDSGRSQAAYEGLKNAFGELFRRNEFIHKAEESTVKDTIIEITGLKKTDPIVRLMLASFDAVRGYITADIPVEADLTETEIESVNKKRGDNDDFRSSNPNKLGLSYQINIVLPETDNVAVFNAIFKSLRDNLLR